jgi:N-acetyl-anhydromuramoyl-L-alanine amidase
MAEVADSRAWHNGWYRYARRLPSANFGLRPPEAVIDLLVIHSISLPPGEYGNGDVQKFFCNQLDHDAHPYFQTLRNLQVSAHFFICRDGALWQFVSCDQRAWHAGHSSYLGRQDCNNHSIGIELEGLEGGSFELQQYETLSAVGAAILNLYPVRHLAGHEHIAVGRKADPGSGFDWPYLMRSLGVSRSWLPGNFQ